MRIKKFRFDDLRTGWHLEETVFDAFNLLVGVSGVGKTKILEALWRVCQFATEGEFNPGPIEWAIEFEHEGQTYRWEGRTEPAREKAFPEDEPSPGTQKGSNGSAQIAREKLENETGTLVARDGKTFLFKEKKLPKLKRVSSAIGLLEDDESIAPANNGLRRILVSKATARPFTYRSTIDDREARVAKYREISKRDDGFNKFKMVLAEAGLSKMSEHAPLAAYYLQEAFPDQFREIKEIFVGIFPSVQDLKVSTSTEADSPFIRHELNIQERGNDNWIGQAEVSSGMLRTLVHLIELSLTPPGSVVIIDDFENSLGVNCMPQLTDLILSRAPDLQFILTSHHPYVINKLPIDTWKLVERHGSRVRVVSARDIPALQAKSHHDAFDRLLNLREFEEGIS